MKSKPFFEAIATLVGTIIGAGVLGIPYVVAKAGFLTGLVDLIVLGVAVLILYLYLGEVVLRTRGDYQLTGYAERYLGKTGKVAMFFSMIFGNYGALVAYIIGVGAALSAIFNSTNSLLFSMLFFGFAFIVIFFGGVAVKESELLMSGLVVLMVIVICVLGIGKIDFSNLAKLSFKDLFLPYGVILFALAGSVAIPEMKKELAKNKKLLKKAIIIGALIPIVLYALFTFVVVGITNLATTEVATIGLGEKIGRTAVLFGNLFAVLSMSTSFLVLALSLKHMYYDYKINRTIAWLLACIPPLLIFLIGNRAFVATLGFTGAIAFGIGGILNILMFWKAKKLGNRRPEYSIKKNALVGIVLIIIFILGIIYEILRTLSVIKI